MILSRKAKSTKPEARPLRAHSKKIDLSSETKATEHEDIPSTPSVSESNPPSAPVQTKQVEPQKKDEPLTIEEEIEAIRNVLEKGHIRLQLLRAAQLEIHLQNESNLRPYQKLPQAILFLMDLIRITVKMNPDHSSHLEEQIDTICNTLGIKI